MINERDKTALSDLTRQIASMLATASEDKSLSGSDFRRVLRFLTDVIQVVDQTFADVYMVLIDIQSLTPDDVKSGRQREIVQELHKLLGRDYYREAVMVCGRLRELRMQYEQHIMPLVQHLPNSTEWRELFWLLEDREGRIIQLVEHTVSDFSRQLDSLGRKKSISTIKEEAAESVSSLRATLSDLQSVKNRILGLSGQAGLFELTAIDRNTAVTIGNLHLGDNYTASQVGAQGPNAYAHDMYMSLDQSRYELEQKIDLPKLANELGDLYNEMQKDASTPEQYEEIGAIGAAHSAAKSGNGKKALEYLAKAGKWSLDIASKIGVTLASEALKQGLGMS